MPSQKVYRVKAQLCHGHFWMKTEYIAGHEFHGVGIFYSAVALRLTLLPQNLVRHINLVNLLSRVQGGNYLNYVIIIFAIVCFN